MGGGPPVLRRNIEKSNDELTAALRKQFASAHLAASTAKVDGDGPGIAAPKASRTADWRDWCDVEDDRIRVPSRRYRQTGLSEGREAYDITAKLFFLPSSDRSSWPLYAQEALQCIFDELGIAAVNLLILSFPGLVFKDEDPSAMESHDAPPNTPAFRTANNSEASPSSDENLDSIISQWALMDGLLSQGKAEKLGVSEVGADQLAALVQRSALKPSVDQIAVRDACEVPKKLTSVAKMAGVALLPHNDCMNVLPSGTLRELLGRRDGGPGILSDGDADGIQGELRPLWVIKYTAFVRDRGVIESKGYIAMAEVD